MLVKLLTGVFDPPPDQLTVPWIYLTILFAAAAVSIALAIRVAERQTDQASAALLLREGG
jgi:putative ABC transport system permease protein